MPRKKVTDNQKSSIARLNAMRHGFARRSPVIPIIEDEEDWERHHKGIIKSLKPKGYLQKVLVRRIATTLWDLDRLTAHQVGATMECIMDVASGMALAANYGSGSNEFVEPDPYELEERQQRRLLPRSTELELIMRYGTTIHRQWVQTLNQLRALQADARGERVPMAIVDVSPPPNLGPRRSPPSASGPALARPASCLPPPSPTMPSMSTPIAIAIDGPVASGKSAVGSLVAQRLGCRFIDTGVMYRAVTWLALERGVRLNDEAALTGLAASAHLEVGQVESGEARVLLDGVDVTPRLRSPEVGEAVSLVSRVPGVRHAMVALQRKLAAEADTVMVGRDIGTVVLTGAKLKVYLDATAEERVRRRHEELLAAGKPVAEEDVRQELALRDAIDSGRDVSPLKPADDAIIIHTDHLSLSDVVDKVLELMQCR